MSRWSARPTLPSSSFPRMSGDEPALLPDVLQYPLFSPREWG